MKQKPFVIGQIGLSFHIAAAAVLKQLLERDGVEVELKEAPHELMYEMLGRGDVDLVCSAWLPGSHGVYIAPYENQLKKLAVLYEPYTIWGVPDYVPQSEVRCVADLAKPLVAERMTKRIQGIGPGAGISRFSREIIAAYELDQLGYHFENGSQKDCFDAFEAAVKDRRWAVVPLWHPQYLHHSHRIRELEEPKGLLRGKDAATLVMRKSAAEKVPAASLDWLTRIYLGNEAVAELDYMINVRKMEPMSAAKQWIERNADIVGRWQSQHATSQDTTKIEETQ